MNKRSKQKYLKVLIIVSIGVIISLFFIISNMKNSNIERQEIVKEQLAETMQDDTYVKMQTHLSEINEQEQKLVSFKSEIANAITEKGVETSEEADVNTMVNNIKNISGLTKIECGWIQTSNYSEVKTVDVGFKPKYAFIQLGYVDATLKHIGVWKYGDLVTRKNQNLNYITLTDTGFTYQALQNGIVSGGCYYFLATDE